MLFNSIHFFIFFSLFFLLYISLNGNYREQNKLLLVAGLVFYGTWDWRFVFLLIFTGLVDYACARWIDSPGNSRKKLGLMCSVVCNLTVLGLFKYYNFFIESFEFLLTRLGLPFLALSLHIVLPVGLSFYTFQSMGYVIDVYRGKIRAERDGLNFSVFVSFFPQLVAGPIERAQNLLPQIRAPREMNLEKIVQGASLFLWGLVKKVVIADQAAEIANLVFQTGANPAPFAAMLGVYAFAIQIYGDFSGYTDMARGIAKIIGFDLAINFKQPYLAVNPSDFWKRWHISLSAWMRDYLYIPLGGNRHGQISMYRSLLITMLLAGLWHGASWMFILWGAYHAVLLISYHWYDKSGRKYFAFTAKIPARIRTALQVFMTFQLICIGWIFFRAPDWGTMTNVLSGFIRSWDPRVWGPWIFHSPVTITLFLVLLVIVIFYQWNHRIDGRPLYRFESLSVPPRLGVAMLLLVLIILCGTFKAQQFIYFQF